MFEFSKIKIPKGKNRDDFSFLKTGILPLRRISDINFEDLVIGKILPQFMGTPIAE